MGNPLIKERLGTDITAMEDLSLYFRRGLFSNLFCFGKSISLFPQMQGFGM